MDTAADNPLVLPTTPSAFVTPLFLLHFAPLMRKGVSEVGLHNALAAFSREVAARRMGCKRAATLIYLGVALFRSDQMITEKEIGTGPAGTAFAHSSTTAIRPPTIAPWTSLHRRLATIHADVMLSSPPTSILLYSHQPVSYPMSLQSLARQREVPSRLWLTTISFPCKPPCTSLYPDPLRASPPGATMHSWGASIARESPRRLLPTLLLKRREPVRPPRCLML